MLSIKESLHKIKQYLKEIINTLEKSHTRKIQLMIAIDFFLLKKLMKSMQSIQIMIT